MLGRVYGIRHPETYELVYVGQTIHPADLRLKGHLAGARTSKTRFAMWLRSLGMAPVVTIFEDGIDQGDLLERETYWINAMRDAGHNLLNSPRNNRGFTGPRSSETRQKISDARKGMTFTDEHRENLKHTPERKAHMKKVLTGQKRTPEQRKRMSDAHRKAVT